MRGFFTLLCVLVAVAASAQYNGPGFYRVRNASTLSYICIKGTSFQKTMNPDAFWPCVLMQQDSAQIADPGSVIYIPGTDDTSLYGQGVDTYSLTGLPMSIDTAKVREMGRPTYIATTQYYQANLDQTLLCIFRDRGNGFTAGTIEKKESRWWIEPLNEGSIDTSYFAVKPASEAVKDADGWYWTSLCCDFPVRIPASGGVEGAYTIESVAMGYDGMYCASPVKLYGQGEVIPAATPVLIKCAYPYASGNKLIPEGAIANNTTFPLVNGMLQGNYFSIFTNYGSLSDKTLMVDYLPAQSTAATAAHLALGVDAEGKVGFFPQPEGTYMAANTAWLCTTGKDLEGVTAVYLTTAPEQPEVVSGDVDGDGEIGVSDVTSLVDLLLAGELRQLNHEAADVDGDGMIGISDVTTLVDELLNK